MKQSNFITEKQDLLITPYLAEGQLPTLLAEALSVSPEGESLGGKTTQQVTSKLFLCIL